jgi:hypothetical protein
MPKVDLRNNGGGKARKCSGFKLSIYSQNIHTYIMAEYKEKIKPKG